MNPKKMRESRTIMTDLVFPTDTNHLHTIFGGKIMALVDKVGAIAAMRHCRQTVVTASSDSFDFLAPVKSGEIVVIEAFVTWTHQTSMEVFVKVEAENLLKGEKRLTAQAYLTYIALDEENKPTPVPQVIPETEEEKAHFSGGRERYQLRQNRRKQET